MKKVFVFTLLFVVAITSFGQKKDTIVNKIYLQFAGGGSSHHGSFVEMGIQANFKNNWLGTFSIHNIKLTPNNIPSDYEPGVTFIFFLQFEDAMPKTSMKLYSFTAGKLFEAGRKVWFTTEAGFSIVSKEKLIFTKQSGTNIDFVYYASNYAINRENVSAVGGMIKADANWAFCSFAGLGAGVFANVNSIQSQIGAQVKLTVGWMNRKKKH